MKQFGRHSYAIRRASRFGVACIFALGFAGSLYVLRDVQTSQDIVAMSDQDFRAFSASFHANKNSARRLEFVAEKALSVSPPDIATSKAATQALLTKRKPCLPCQNRLAVFDVMENGQLTEPGLEALRRSYALAPYADSKMMRWRLALAADYWGNLDADLRQFSLSQITVMALEEKDVPWLLAFETEVEPIAKRIALLTPQ